MPRASCRPCGHGEVEPGGDREQQLLRARLNSKHSVAQLICTRRTQQQRRLCRQTVDVENITVWVSGSSVFTGKCYSYIPRCVRSIVAVLC